MWCFPGGGLDEGETPVAGAVRELAEETGVRLAAGGPHRPRPVRAGHRRARHLPLPRLRRPYDARARSSATRDARWCSSGPTRCPTSTSCRPRRSWHPELRRWIEEHPFVPEPDGRTFAGVVLVDREGRILLQERDEHAPIDPEKWGLAGGHVEAGEDFEPAAYRELEEETGVRLEPGTLTLFGEFVVDHTRAHGTWDRMQVFVAATDLTDADIDCQEGRQIVFVEPDVARGLDLTSAAADVVPAFLDSAAYASMAP